ncbi:MAG: triose-phosphate isomerase [Candidatus Daviesbacteria bacterium]|nr:triose-phosphate isomerase [Candidatus Daviesbacteria bacterium]
MAGLDKNIWVIANWKSNKTIAEALDWVSKVGPEIPKLTNLKAVVCPVFSALSEVKKAITVGNFPLMAGSQDLSPFGVGAYTGEEPVELLSGLASMAILGHSERRQNFGETDEMIIKKVDQALKGNIIPLVCVQSEKTLVPQGCKLIAYEPIWAIGTGNPDTPENANKTAKVLKEKYGQDLEILYGGSVTGENAKAFIFQSNINGMLIGRASLDAEEFIKICKVMERI